MAEHIQPITTRMQPACGTEIARNQHVYGATTAPSISSYQKEAPRLCRGGSRSLTFQEVVHRRDFQS